MRRSATILLASCLLAAPGLALAQPVDVSFLYKLSSTTGVIPFHGMNVTYDPWAKETLVFGGGRVSLFNPSGMETYTFGDDPTLGGVTAVAPTESGDYLFLSYVDGKPIVVRANFRGEFKERIVPTGLPAVFDESFLPNVIGWAKDRIYLAELARMRLVVLSMDGAFLRYHDLAELCGIPGKADDNGIRGLRVEPDGDVLFTVATLFQAFVLHPDGTARSFGQRGSAPGKFNVITGIARDERGYYYVADILKSAVLVFDKNFRWVKEFGYRGGRPGSIFAPVDIAAGDGKVFVSQFARKGVSVFEIKIPDLP